ncbi:ArsR/SmtB family transcription factor [Demequina oxidasica]|uniref:ArsR/SmtB family transcription factor n=1 Tax=Demequina oxidasica TaxID=676199 RepID=UPI000785802E|nr:metalloregulator ArsR/SmtB family transcription factor [Demequina oxidasica]
MIATATHASAMSRIGHALSDSTRTSILLSLRSGQRSPADLAEDLGVSRQSMSNHLTCLRGCGLVLAERAGRHAHYRLADPALFDILDELLAITLTLDPTCCTGDECRC